MAGETIGEKIMKEAEEQKKREDALNANINRQVEAYTGLHKEYDTARYTGKATLKQLIGTWRQEFQQNPEILRDKELAAILKEVESYAEKDITATHSGIINAENTTEEVRTRLSAVKNAYYKEGKQVNQIRKDLDKYIAKLEKEALTYGADKDKNQSSHDEEKIQTVRQVMAENLKLFFDDQVNGYLEPVPEDAYHIVDKKIRYSDNDTSTDMRNMPLFPHEPSVNDIRQGYLHDCYMVSSLSTVAAKDPQKIKEAMRDNGDGTVTVRFFQRIKPEDQPEAERKDHDIVKPFYVTVEKTVPDSNGARSSLWVSMIEKAFAASGIGVHTLYMRHNRPVPPDIDELYEKFRKMPEYQWPDKSEYPWLFDENNKLVKWEKKYEAIHGGSPSEFLEVFLGEDYNGQINDLDNTLTVTARDITIEYLLETIAAKSSEKFAEKVKAEFSKETSKAAFQLKTVRVLAGLYEKNLDWQMLESDESGKKIENYLKGSTGNFGYQKYGNAIRKGIEKALRMKNQDESALSCIEKAVEERKYKIEDYFEDLVVDPEEVLNNMLADFEAAKDRLAAKVRTNKYPAAYEELYEDIKTKLEKGLLIECSTHPNEQGDRKVERGLNFQHAYSVLGVSEELINGRTYKFITIRNPHGLDNVPEYTFGDGFSRVETGTDKNAEGIFRVELSHFVSDIKFIYINGKEIEYNAPEKVGEINKQKSSSYNRLLGLLSDGMDAVNTEKLPEQEKTSFEGIKRILKRTRDEMAKTEVLGHKGTELDTFFKYVKEHLEKEGIKESNTPSVRLVRSGMRIAELYKAGVDNPVEEITKDISGYVMQRDKSFCALMEIAGKNELSDGIALDIKETSAVVKMYKKADPALVKSSERYKAVGIKISELGAELKKFNDERTMNNMAAYIAKLGELGKAGQQYLEYKKSTRGGKNGMINTRSSLERKRVEAIHRITEYAITKSKRMYKTYLETTIACNMLNAQSPGKNIKPESDAVRELATSEKFRAMIKDKSIDELKTLAAENPAVKKQENPGFDDSNEKKEKGNVEENEWEK